MHNWPRVLFFGIFAAAAASAGAIDVTAESQVTAGYNNTLLFYISSTYASHAPLDSPYPGSFTLLFGGLPVEGPAAPIPGTSAVYTPGILFRGDLESADGSVTIPLYDSNAGRLGLPAGDMLLGTGYRSGSTYSGAISALTATATLSPEEAAALFASGEAVVRLRNLGEEITFGYPGSPISGAFYASLVSSDGTLSVGARTMKVELVHNPEPATVGLLVIGFALIAVRALGRGKRHC